MTYDSCSTDAFSANTSRSSVKYVRRESPYCAASCKSVVGAGSARIGGFDLCGLDLCGVEYVARAISAFTDDSSGSNRGNLLPILASMSKQIAVRNTFGTPRCSDERSAFRNSYSSWSAGNAMDSCSSNSWNRYVDRSHLHVESRSPPRRIQNSIAAHSLVDHSAAAPARRPRLHVSSGLSLVATLVRAWPLLAPKWINNTEAPASLRLWHVQFGESLAFVLPALRR